nr:hypothetical protein [Pandoravirus massiliensis]
MISSPYVPCVDAGNVPTGGQHQRGIVMIITILPMTVMASRYDAVGDGLCVDLFDWNSRSVVDDLATENNTPDARVARDIFQKRQQTALVVGGLGAIQEIDRLVERRRGAFVLGPVVTPVIASM